MSLTALADFAVANNNATAAKVPLYDLPIEEARAKVRIKDGNKKVRTDGGVALTLTLGRTTLSLDAVAEGATRVNATKEQIDEFTKILNEALNTGTFDKAITDCQKAAKPKEETKVLDAQPEQTVLVDVLEPTGVQLSVPPGVDLESI